MLGEMPHVFAQIPFPKASLAILEVFTTMTGLDLDFSELAEQAQMVEEQLAELMGDSEGSDDEGGPEDGEEESDEPAAEPEGKLSTGEEERIERLFDQARRDRKKAFELKHVLDRLGVFKDYEDRFLDLFRRAG